MNTVEEEIEECLARLLLAPSVKREGSGPPPGKAVATGTADGDNKQAVGELLAQILKPGQDLAGILEGY